MERWRSLAWPAALVATLLVLYGSSLGPERTLAFRDTDRLYAPMRTLVDASLRAGRLPLWNPHECLGKPLLGDGVHSVLHPVSVTGAFVAEGNVDFLALAYLILAALGGYALARSVGATPAASAAAGLAFSLSGFVLSMTGNLAFLAGAASFPWVAVAARHAGAGRPFAPAATAVATGVAFLSGDTQSAIVGTALGLSLAWDAGAARGTARALAGATAGLLLAGVQLAATRAAFAEASRADALAAGEAEQWALEPLRLIEWLVPGLFNGDFSLARIPEILQAGPLSGTFAESVHLGAPLLLLAGVAFAAPWTDPARRRTVRVLAVAGAVLLWLALGHHLGARQLLDFVPVWSRFRYSEKLMAPLSLCLAVAGAMGIDRAADARIPRAATRLAIGGAILAVSALAAVALAPDALRGLLPALEDEPAAFLLRNLLHGLAHPALGLLALLAVDRFASRHRTILLGLVLAGASIAAAPFAAHLGDQRAHVAPSPFRFEAPPPGPRLAHPYERSLAPTAEFDAVDVGAYYLRLVLTPAVNVERGIDSVDCYGPFWSRRRVMLKDGVGDWMLRSARRFGLTHVVLPPPGDDAEVGAATAAIAGGRRVEGIDDPPIEVWAVPHRPWALFAAEALPASSPAEARGLFAAAARGTDDGAVVVEAPAPIPTSPGRIIALARGAEELRIDAESAGPGLLVVNDAWWPGWRAWVDGDEVEILPADLVVRAVRWPAGRHRLLMRYEPPEIVRGLVLSALGALATLGLALPGIASAFRRRPARDTLPE